MQAFTRVEETRAQINAIAIKIGWWEDVDVFKKLPVRLH